MSAPRLVSGSGGRVRYKVEMRSLVRFVLVGLGLFVLVFALPLGTHALWWMSQDRMPARWSAADWSSAGVLPSDARAAPDALVRIFAARTGHWRGVVADHGWIVVKEDGAPAYTRFDKVGWGSPIRVNGWAPDGRWYSNPPQTILALDGAAARAAIPAIRRAVAEYPHARPGDYRAWPGPNSNTFVAFVLDRAARSAPALAVALPPTALGKDWSPHAGDVSLAPGGTGVRISLGGLAGLRLGWQDGLELNLLGLVAGLDLLRPALKLPGWGRIGFPIAKERSATSRRAGPLAETSSAGIHARSGASVP